MNEVITKIVRDLLQSTLPEGSVIEELEVTSFKLGPLHGFGQLTMFEDTANLAVADG